LNVRFSVITPSFRQLDWLELCAASVADQGVEVEHLVQDAGSPGVEAWKASHPAVQVFAEKDSGMYDAINRGLRRATGDICSYLNCDEQYLPNTLHQVGDYFARHPKIDVLFGDTVLLDSSLVPVAYRRVVLPQRWHTLLHPLGVFTCSTFFRRQLVDDGALFDPSWRIIGDKAWLFSLHNRGYRMAVLPKPLAVFALTGTNLSQHENFPKERLRWRREVSAPYLFLSPLVLFHHRWCKWRAGAYRKFSPDLRYYRPKDLTHRTSIPSRALRAFWPK
jgi:glycosyltransferase involved in cell wall biosynthesis